jgi:hypothetical protein
MLKRFLLCLLLLTAASRAGAVDYTDIYYIPAESGWGANVVQSDTFLFVTFFIYGPDNKPTWYSAQLNQDASGNFNGTLYATTGTFYAQPWKTSDQVPTVVGTASFQPTSAYTAKLVYTVTTPTALVATVTKLIQRQTLTAIRIGGTYSGAQSGAYSACSNGSDNFAYIDTFNLQVDQFSGGGVTFTFAYSQLDCTLAGTLTPFGQLYTMPTAAYSCKDLNGKTVLNTNASMTEIKATAQGIEGKISAPTVNGNCREDATFSAVLH